MGRYIVPLLAMTSIVSACPNRGSPMRVFVLTTGRSGSLTLSQALAHTTNSTGAQESLSVCFDGRLVVPVRPIVVDNRLAFFPGPLPREYHPAHYVWLRRNRND